MRSEIFGQGTLMLRLSIQISMILAIPLMATLLFVWRPFAPWYICYVLLFNVLVGPVFSAGSVTSERERQTLDLLLTTLIRPGQMLWGKLISGLRVSTVLTAFLLWPLLLAAIMVSDYWTNLPTLLAYVLVVGLTCITTANIALFCSTIAAKTTSATISAYLVIALLFFAPVAYDFFVSTYFYSSSAVLETRYWAGMLSPFSTVHNIPLYVDSVGGGEMFWRRPSSGEPNVLLGYRTEDLFPLLGYALVTVAINLVLCGLIVAFFQRRWRFSA
jgi:ABC-type transport system involved in multi-copper enzyme maturation permease subunit